MILSSTAKIWGHVPNPVIPSSASESEDYKTVRGLVWYLTQPLTLQKQKLSPIDEKTPSYRHKDSTNGWARPESRCLGPRPSSLHQPKSSPDSQNDLGVTITSSNTPQMGRKEGGWREGEMAQGHRVLWQEIRNMKGQTVKKFLLWTSSSSHWTPYLALSVIMCWGRFGISVITTSGPRAVQPDKALSCGA